MKGWCDEHGWYPGGKRCAGCHLRLPHPNTDLRAVYPPAPDPRVDAGELARLRASRRERPSLGQIATACRTYHEGGSSYGLWQILAPTESGLRRLDTAGIDLDVDPRDDPRTAWLYEQPS